MDQRNYFLILLILLVTVAWYQHSQMIKRISEFEDLIDESFTQLDYRITELEPKIDDFDSRIDDLETKTMFMD